MRKFKSHKEVFAVKIAGLEFREDGSALVTPAEEDLDVGVFETRPGWRDRFAGDESEMGYFVLYEDGFSSWSPSAVFEKECVELADARSTWRVNFAEALLALKEGYRVTRKGWNGKDMFLYLVPGSTFQVNRLPLLDIYEEGTEIQYHPHIDMKTAQGYCVPWLASQADLLSDDWEILPDLKE